MKTFFCNMASSFFALLTALALAFAQGSAQAQPAYVFSQQELDQMLAPIAFYPDALLSHIFMAATYPMEVVEAARRTRERPDLAGDEAVRAAENEDWDASVKSLLAFPQVLARMGENLQWTQSLGDAFLDQQAQVMDTVQTLRRKAQAAGNLRSDDRVSVIESGPNLLVQPFDPQVVYVPYYDPTIVYGPWWWPAYPPMYLRPGPGYYARQAYAGGYYWGPAIGISAGFFFGAIDWRRRQVRVVQVNNHYSNNQAAVRHANASPPVNLTRPRDWHHDPDRGAQARVADARRSDAGMQVGPGAWFAGRRPDARPDVHTGAPPARDAVIARPVNTSRVESRQEIRIRPEWHANQVAARFEPSARPEAPRAPLPRLEYRAAPGAARQEPAHIAVARHEAAARHLPPPASAPRADIRPPPAAAYQEPRAQVLARPRAGP